MILDIYFARRYVTMLLIVIAVFSGLIVMIESLEQIRRFGEYGLSGLAVLKMAALRLPDSLYELLPIVVVLATLAMFLGLARSSELVVTRAAGRSALRALVPSLIVSILFGVLTVTVIGPIAASASRTYEQRTTELVGTGGQAFSVASEGLWLREGNARGQSVIRAARSNFDGSVLYDVTMLEFDPNGILSGRIEAESARIENGAWVLTDAKRWPLRDVENPEASATTVERISLPTTLTLDEIRDRFGSPESVSIWDLPAYIDKLESAGFSARNYRMWFHASFALPLTFAAMMLIGAGFTMRHTRLGGTAPLVITAILLSFLFFFLRNFVMILGQNGQVPIILAAWGPPVAVIGLAATFLLHTEDG